MVSNDCNADPLQDHRSRFERLLEALRVRSDGRQPGLPPEIAERLEPIYLQLAAITRTLPNRVEVEPSRRG